MRILTKALAAAMLCAFMCLAGPAQAQTAGDYNAEGVGYYETGQWMRAIESFERAYKLAPDNQTVRRNLANAYQSYANHLAREKDIGGAIDQLVLAIGVDPENAQPLVQLGAYYLQEGLVPEAIFRLEEAIELAPKNVDAHFLLGEAYYKDNDISSALDQWEWVYQVDPDREGLVDRLESALREEQVEFNFKGLASSHFNITYNPETEGKDVQDILRTLESAYREIGRDMGHVYPPAPIQVTLYSAAGFSETTRMGEHVGALYDGNRIRVPVFDKNGEIIEKEELERRLYHEYTHVVVRHLAKDNVPWWLNEGLAETLSRDLNAQELEYLRQSNAEGLLFSLTELTEGQLERLEVDDLKLAYRQSHATVALLKQRFGLRRIGGLLEDLGYGANPEDALLRLLRYNYDTLELAVANYIEKG